MRGYDPSRTFLFRGHAKWRALGHKPRGEALTLGESFHFERDCIYRLDKRIESAVDAQSAICQSRFCGQSGRPSGAELGTRPGCDKSNDGSDASRYALEDEIVFTQCSVKNLGKHRHHRGLSELQIFQLPTLQDTCGFGRYQFPRRVRCHGPPFTSRPRASASFFAIPL